MTTMTDVVEHSHHTQHTTANRSYTTFVESNMLTAIAAVSSKRAADGLKGYVHYCTHL